MAIICWFLALASQLPAQELGPEQLFGSDGRLFSSGKEDYYLLSRQSYVTEDSTGYEGRVRIVRHYEGGAYDVLLKDYIAHCRSYDNRTYVVWLNPEERDAGTGYTVSISNPDRFPGSAKKESYNLFWATCHAQFRKFK